MKPDLNVRPPGANIGHSPRPAPGNLLARVERLLAEEPSDDLGPPGAHSVPDGSEPQPESYLQSGGRRRVALVDTGMPAASLGAPVGDLGLNGRCHPLPIRQGICKRIRCGLWLTSSPGSAYLIVISIGCKLGRCTV